MQLNLTIIRKFGINAPMIVCICNRLRETEVQGAIAQGARCAEDVHAACGVNVNCGCCLDAMDEMIDSVRRPCRAAGQLAAAI